MMKWSKAMKKIYCLTALLLAVLSCSKENNPEPVSGPALMHVEIAASKAATRTVMADLEGQSVLWSEGDEISVFDTDGTCAGHRFTSKLNDQDASRASFTGDVHEGTTTIHALYPYDASSSISNGVITSTLPSTQDATSGSFANGAALAVASGTVDEDGIATGMTFNNLCAVIAFKTPSYLSNARSVVISSKSGTPMSGTVTIDCVSGAITSVSGSSSVTIGVSALEDGATYFAAVAPGTYTDGFTFTVTTSGGNTYTAQTTRTIPAMAGEIYMLGTVGLVLDGYTPAVTLQHAYSGGVLTGTDASVSIAGLAGELAGMASWDIQLKNGNGVLVRSLNTATGTMQVENGYTYLPQGTYYLTCSYSLNNNGSIKTRQLPGSQAVSPAPSVAVTLGGYTSYDCYKGTNGQSASASTANSKNGSTIYDLSVSVNIAPDILHDSKYSSAGTYSFNGASAQTLVFSSGSRTHSIGTLNNQSWKTHTLDASFTFDGVTVNATQRRMHVTGLPHIANPPTNSGDHKWEKMEGTITWNSDHVELYYSAANYPRIKSPAFYCPEDINVTVNPRIVRNNSLLPYKYDLVISLSSDQHIIKTVSMEKGDVFESSFTATMNSSLNVWRIQYKYLAAGPRTNVYKFNILYQ